MQSKIAQKYAEAFWRDEQRRWEPWKVVAAAMSAGAALATAIFTFALWAISHIK